MSLRSDNNAASTNYADLYKISYMDLCRKAAHNRAEREALDIELSRVKQSIQRKKYLQTRMVDLVKERRVLCEKEQRIRKHRVRGEDFII